MNLICLIVVAEHVWSVSLKLLNEEITSDIHKHKHNPWKVHLDAHSHNIQQQNNNHTQKYCELFNQTIHRHTRQTNPLTEQHYKYIYITLHSPQLRSKMQ